jgi:hypothetical protein
MRASPGEVCGAAIAAAKGRAQPAAINTKLLARWNHLSGR